MSDCEIIQGIWPPGPLRIEKETIGDCKPGIVVKGHLCEKCSPTGGEIYLALINPAGDKVGCMMFPSEMALEVANAIMTEITRIQPKKVMN